MKMYSAVVKLEAGKIKMKITIPCVTSRDNALHIVANMENCPRQCLSIIEFKEIVYTKV